MSYFSSFDIICYQETKVDEFDILSLPGFTAISQPQKQRQYRKSGGLAGFVKDNISNFCEHHKTESDYILWISIDKRILDTDENIILGTVYMFDFDDSTSSFFDITTVLENMNIPLDSVSRDNKTNTTGYWLIDTCKNNNLFIVNGRFGKDKGIGATTFRDKSLIDYTLCSAESF